MKEDFDIIQHARKSLLFKNGEPWIKKDSGIFDAKMGAFDGTQVCEMVGIHILSLIISKCNEEGIGLYCDVLAVFKNISCPHSEKIKKDLQAIFNENSWKIENAIYK